MQAIKLIFALVLVVILGIGSYMTWQQFQGASEFNALVAELDRINALDDDQARHEALVQFAPKLEAVVAEHDAQSAIGQQARKELARVYRDLGDYPGNTFAQSADWYRKSLPHDPDGLSDTQRRLLEATDNP